jgi:DNA-binding GntR family transcriptional regulator
MHDMTPPKELSPRSAIRHNLADLLLLDVFTRKLPAGSRLIVQKLTSQFGVSSTPVREALVELESIGIVEFVHNRGVVVKPFGRRQLREIYQLRKVLEVEATRGATGNIDPQELQALDKELAKLQRSSVVRKDWADREMASDRKLHGLVAAHCGSNRLTEEIRRYERLVQVIRDIVGNELRAQQVAVDEHRKIVSALIENDPQRAAEAMGEHIDRTANLAQEVIFGDGE